MIKKEYQKPAAMTDIATAEQILAGSVAKVNATGLGDEALNKDEETGNPWELAW